MDDFELWIERIQSQGCSINIVYLNDIPTALQDTHTLLQDHSEQQSKLNKIYEEVKCLIGDATPQDGATLETAYSDLVQKYQVRKTQMFYQLFNKKIFQTESGKFAENQTKNHGKNFRISQSPC